MQSASSLTNDEADCSNTMAKSFKEIFLNFAYVRIKSEWISIRAIGENKCFEDIPMVAIDENSYVLAIGKKAESIKSEKVTVLKNAFSHPRTLINDFDTAKLFLRHALDYVAKGTWSILRPIMIIQPMERLEGGLTRVEAHGLMELGVEAGARSAYVWTGRELTDQEILTRRFPGDNWKGMRPRWAKVR